MNAPAHWGTTPLRGCAVCAFGRDASGKPTRAGGHDADTCICPSVTGRNLPEGAASSSDWPLGIRGVPVVAARANTGACGPEAHHLTFRGLR